MAHSLFLKYLGKPKIQTKNLQSVLPQAIKDAIKLHMQGKNYSTRKKLSVMHPIKIFVRLHSNLQALHEEISWPSNLLARGALYLPAIATAHVL